MRYYIECWHSGDDDGGHHYAVDTNSVCDALCVLIGLLVMQGAVGTVTYVECSTSRTAGEGDAVVHIGHVIEIGRPAPDRIDPHREGGMKA